MSRTPHTFDTFNRGLAPHDNRSYRWFVHRFLAPSLGCSVNLIWVSEYPTIPSSTQSHYSFLFKSSRTYNPYNRNRYPRLASNLTIRVEVRNVFCETFYVSTILQHVTVVRSSYYFEIAGIFLVDFLPDDIIFCSCSTRLLVTRALMWIVLYCELQRFLVHLCGFDLC